MLQMKFNPRFIEAFRSGQKITSLRMMDFQCFPSSQPDPFDGEYDFYHADTLNRDITYFDYSAGESMMFDEGTPYIRVSKLNNLLKRQPYKQSDEIELVTEIEGGEIMPFATAIIAEILVIKGDQIDDVQAILDGFNPDRDPLSDLLAFMRDVYLTADPVAEMYWLYTFTNIQMLSGWEGDA